MKSFKQFLVVEALHHGVVGLAGGGSEGKRHAEKYIDPHVGAGHHTHVVKTKSPHYAAGTELHVHGHKEENGKRHVLVSHDGEDKKYIEQSKLYKPREDYKYNDEHATVKVWNHAVHRGHGHMQEHIAHEIEHAKSHPEHPLSFEKAGGEGFLGGKKTDKHKKAYYEELHTAAHTVHALAHHEDFHEAVKHKHHAVVMGGSRGHVSEVWKKHGATDRGGISKADVAIGPKEHETQGIKVSLKKGGGSQLASPGPEEASAIHDYATDNMLHHHPKHKNKSAAHKKAVKHEIMEHMKHVAHHMNAARGTEGEELRHHIREGNRHLHTIHDKHPELNHYVRLEATSGQGKFGKHSAHAAQHITIGATKKEGAKVKRIEDVDHSGPRPTISKGKKLGPNTALTMRLKS